MSYSVEQATPVARPAQRGTAAAQARGGALESIGLLLILVFIMLPIAGWRSPHSSSAAMSLRSRCSLRPRCRKFVTIFQPPLSFGPLLRNSVVIAGATVLISTTVGAHRGIRLFALSFIGSNALMIWVLAIQFIPQVVITIPFLTCFARSGWSIRRRD